MIGRTEENFITYLLGVNEDYVFILAFAVAFCAFCAWRVAVMKAKKKRGGRDAKDSF